MSIYASEDALPIKYGGGGGEHPAFGGGKDANVNATPLPPIKTLRDEFAMAALSVAVPDQIWNGRHVIADAQKIAEQCYTIADAMMKAREGK